MQGTLQAAQQARAQLEQSIQSHRTDTAHATSMAAQAAAASQADLHRLEQNAKALQQELQAARIRTDEDRAQIKQLATALTAAHDEYQVGNLAQCCRIRRHAACRSVAAAVLLCSTCS